MKEENETQEELVEGIHSGIEGKTYLLGIPEVNLRTILTSFYIGTGCQDVGNKMSFLCIPGSYAWHNIF